MVISNVKDMAAQSVSQYEKNNGAGLAGVNARQTAGQPDGKSAAFAASPNVTVDFSTKSQDFVQIKNAISQLPEVREEVVQALKAQVESGAYKIDSARIAGKMVKESVLDIFA
jgi:flagellar biosynthesis anti-sigma factor FlgM